MEESETQQPVDTTQQVTSKTPATKQKNPKRVAAGKATAQKTKQAREQQKKALVEVQSIIANKNVDPPPVESTMTTTQWLSVISIIVSLAGVYYKQEEIKAFLPKKILLYHLLWLCRLLWLCQLMLWRRLQKEALEKWIEHLILFL